MKICITSQGSTLDALTEETIRTGTVFYHR